jgi:hypothetical protein
MGMVGIQEEWQRADCKWQLKRGEGGRSLETKKPGLLAGLLVREPRADSGLHPVGVVVVVVLVVVAGMSDKAIGAPGARQVGLAL